MIILDSAPSLTSSSMLICSLILGYSNKPWGIQLISTLEYVLFSVCHMLRSLASKFNEPSVLRVQVHGVWTCVDLRYSSGCIDGDTSVAVGRQGH